MTAARALDAHGLLDVAFELADVAISDRFDSARLRRSVSTSYYALFHELTFAAAALLCGEDAAGETQRNQVVRWISHTDLFALAHAVLDPKRPAGNILAPSVGLGRIAEIFISLQEWRQWADYDHGFVVMRVDASRLAMEASEAIATARELWAEGDEAYLRFLRLMVGAVRIAKNR